MSSMNRNETLQQKKTEMEVARRLMQAITLKVDELREQFGSAPEDRFRLEPFEKNVLMKINNSGILEGLAAGILTLVTVRRIRAYVVRRTLGNMNPAQPPTPPTTYGFGPSSDSPMQNMIVQRSRTASEIPNNPFHSQQHASQGGTPFQSVPKQGFLPWSLGWTLDLLLAGSTMVTVGVYSMNMEARISDVAQIPLAPGYSTISREFCPVAVQWLGQLQEESKRGDTKITNVLKNPLSKGTEGYLQFARNCQLRLRYEEKLRSEKGVTDSEYRVAIPSPGVPLDDEGYEDSIAITSDSASLSSTSGWGEEPALTDDTFDVQDGNNNSNNNNNMEWEDGFPKDQDNDNRRSKW